MTGETENGQGFISQYVHPAERTEGSVKHLSFSTAISDDAYLETNFLAGDNSERVFNNQMFSVSANGYIKSI